jgi:predicted MFS family arabinose efflux permease
MLTKAVKDGDHWVINGAKRWIGLANIAGSLTSGYLSGRVSKVWLLVVIYALRGVAIAVFILLPPSPVTAIGFGITAIGFGSTSVSFGSTSVSFGSTLVGFSGYFCHATVIF